MRPEHSKTKTETETRECETETETETSPVKLIACESNTNRYASFIYYTHEVNDEPILHSR